MRPRPGWRSPPKNWQLTKRRCRRCPSGRNWPSRRGFGCPPWPKGSARPCGSPASELSIWTSKPRRPGGPDPDELDAQAEQVAAAERQLLGELAATRSRLDAARAELAERERDATEAEQAHVAAVQAEADRREGLARLAGQVETMRARVESIHDGVAKLSERVEESCSPRPAGSRVRNRRGPGRRTRPGAP